jgi:hypothetical protein
MPNHRRAKPTGYLSPNLSLIDRILCDHAAGVGTPLSRESVFSAPGAAERHLPHQGHPCREAAGSMAPVLSREKSSWHSSP